MARANRKNRYRKSPPRHGATSLRLFIIAAVLACHSGATAQQTGLPSVENLHRWGAVTLFHGLPSDHVRAIAQDRDGTILLGTDAGLSRYDGRRVQKLTGNGAEGASVRAIAFDHEGTAWIGTDSGAARLINGEAEKIPETDGDSIRAVTFGKDRVFLSGAGGVVYDCKTGVTGGPRVTVIGEKESPLLAVERDGGLRTPLELTSALLADDRLFVGSRSRGLLVFAVGSDLGEPVEVASRPRPFFVESLAMGSDGRLWLGVQTGRGERGLFYAPNPVESNRLHPAQLQVPTGTVNALTFSPEGDLWVATDGQGVLCLRDGEVKKHFTFENTAGGLRSDRVYSAFIDREGVVWFGTDRGACRFDSGGVSTELLSIDPESNVARALLQSSSGRLWCGTNRGLFVRARDGSWQAVSGMNGRTVHSIAEYPRGRILVGTATGLFGALETASHQFDFSPVTEDTAWNARAICQFRGSLYVGSFGGGLDMLNAAGRTQVWPASNTASRGVLSLHVDSNKLWIGTVDEGVLVYDGAGISSHPDLEALAGASVWSITGALEEALWFATSRGLYVYTAGRLEPVISNCEVRSVARASPSNPELVWCASAGCGLFKVLITSSGKKVVAKIDAEQGLPSQNAFSIAVGTGELEGVWVGTGRGVVRYVARNIPPLLNVSRGAARRAYSAEEVISGLVLDYPQTGLTVEVAAVSSRTYPEQFQYIFKLSGADGTRIQTRLSRDPRLVLDGLAPNNYRVEALAYNIDLVESDPISFDLTITAAPFPWTSTGLAVLLALALIALGWGWRQNRRLGRTNRELADTRFQLANETETERRRIARDLHDQTLADLRRLLMMADDLPGASGNGQKSSDAARFRNQVESISTEIRRICEDLSPSTLANVGLAAALEWALGDAVAQSPTAHRLKYEFDCEEGIEEGLSLSPAEQIQVYRIVQEALTNICRHSGATLVRMRLTAAGEELVIELADNGCGFDQSSPAASNGRGIANIRSRASLIKASVAWFTGGSTGGFTGGFAEASAMDSTAGGSQGRIDEFSNRPLGAESSDGLPSDPSFKNGTVFTLRRPNCIIH